MTLDASGNLVLYVNGASVLAVTAQAAPTVSRSHLYLGKSWWNQDAILNGGLADLAFALGTVFSAADAASLDCGTGCSTPGCSHRRARR